MQFKKFTGNSYLAVIITWAELIRNFMRNFNVLSSHDIRYRITTILFISQIMSM